MMFIQSGFRATTIVIISFFLYCVMDRLSIPLATAEQVEHKIDARVLADSENGQTSHFLIVLSEQADVSGAAAWHGKEKKGLYVTQLLRQTAARTQPAVTKELEARGMSYRSYWITNMIAAQGNRQQIEALAKNPAIAKIEPNRAILLAKEPIISMPHAELNGVAWGIEKINAPDVWAMGYRGEGMVVANQDTGHDWDHPALINQYRGWDGQNADHNYYWWDAIHEDINGNGSNPCGFESREPCDDHGHGTHALGTSIGDDGAGNQIGVAPAAKWISCRNMEQGYGRPSTYTECFQFFMAPTDLNGDNPDPLLAPDVVSNSWGCPIGPPPSGEDCLVDSFLSTIENMRAAGITIVVAAGNSGPACNTVESPPAYHDAVIAVGATNSSDGIASFSSRGPASADGSNRLKPDISAPGVSIYSSTNGGGYNNLSGTSMAAPHVAGAVVLLQQAHPSLRGDVDGTEQALFGSALGLTTTENCGDIPGSTLPNNTYGYGLLDILQAVQSVPTTTATPTNTPTANGQPSNTPTAGAQPTNTPSSTEIDPVDGGTLMSPDSDVRLIFPSGAVSTTITITYTEQTTPSQETGSYLFAGMSFRIESSDSNGNPVTTFNEPFTLTLHYNPNQLPAEINETSLNLAYWNENKQQWDHILPCTGCQLDTEANILTIMLDHLTEFALLGKEKNTSTQTIIFLPVITR